MNYANAQKDFVIRTEGDTHFITRRYGGERWYSFRIRWNDHAILQPSPMGGVEPFTAPAIYRQAIEAWLRGEDIGADLAPRHRQEAS